MNLVFALVFSSFFILFTPPSFFPTSLAYSASENQGFPEKANKRVPNGSQVGSPSKDYPILEDEELYADYIVRVYSSIYKDNQYLIVLQDGHEVYHLKAFKVYLGYMYKNEPEFNNEMIKIGKDITGRGFPNMVVTEWSGGAHCCFNFYIFELGKSFRLVDKLDAGDGDLSHFADLDSDGLLEFVTADWTFAYWNSSFAGSPAPKVILRFDNDKYHLARDLMRKPSPSAEEIESKVHSVLTNAKWKEGKPPVDLWSEMLDLIYSGHLGFAWEFFDKAWAKGVPGKKKFLKAFRSQLSKSQYYGELIEMNSPKLP